MRTTKPAAGSLRRLALTTLGGQIAALAALSTASLVVARTTDTAVVGEYALLRVLPWLLAVACSAGLPVSSAYYLAGPEKNDRRLRPTLLILALLGGTLGAAVWLAVGIALRPVYFPTLSGTTLSLSALLVITQLMTVTAKACCQGANDIIGANMVIVAEELMFLPCYGAVVFTGHAGGPGVVLSLLGGGALASAVGIGRLVTQRFFQHWHRPSVALARRIVWYGARGQLGNVMWLLNLRLDFLILGAMAGPGELGIYAVASKFAELMRLGPTALNYVLYPRFASLAPARATSEMRRLLPRSTVVVALTAPVVAALAIVGLPLLYGPAYHAAVTPACIIVIGLAPEGAAAVTSALLWGVGRPGVNSLAMAVGLVITIALDASLIPAHGAVGAAIASAVAYAATTAMLAAAAARAARRIDSLDTSSAQGPDVVTATLAADNASRAS